MHPLKVGDRVKHTILRMKMTIIAVNADGSLELEALPVGATAAVRARAVQSEVVPITKAAPKPAPANYRAAPVDSEPAISSAPATGKRHR